MNFVCERLLPAEGARDPPLHRTLNDWCRGRSGGTCRRPSLTDSRRGSTLPARELNLNDVRWERRGRLSIRQFVNRELQLSWLPRCVGDIDDESIDSQRSHAQRLTRKVFSQVFPEPFDERKIVRIHSRALSIYRIPGQRFQPTREMLVLSPLNVRMTRRASIREVERQTTARS